jgi:hypothetical protein
MIRVLVFNLGYSKTSYEICKITKYIYYFIIFGMWRPVSLVGTDVLEEHVASIFRVEGISEPSSLKNRLQEGPHGATSQKTAFFIEIF